MKLIVGLGNTGDLYVKTRHNLGFMIVDRLAELGQPSWHHNHDFNALLSEGPVESVMLVKPLTMMNSSGEAVGRLQRYYKLDPGDIWAIYDDIDLPFGQLRLRRSGGGDSSHNGVKSIVASVGEAFGRVRLGVDNEQLNNSLPAAKFVLSRFNKAEQTQLPQIINQAASLIQNQLQVGQLDNTTHKLVLNQ